MKTVLIYRSRLLPVSETFIRHHYDSLDRYRPVFAGLRAVAGIAIDDTRPILLEDGKRRPASIAAFMATGYAPKFCRRIAAAKPDLIHAHFAVDAVDMLPLARKLGIPLVVTLHGYDVTCSDDAFRRMGPQGWNFLWRRRKLFRQADLFLAVSDFICDKAIAAGAPAGRTVRHYLGVDLKKFSKPAPRKNTVLYVGRLVEKKGLGQLISALAKAGANARGVSLRVVGDGPLRADFEAQARSQLKDCAFLGAQPHRNVVAELQTARIFCVPSVTGKGGDEEALGLVFLEAQAMGVPVVSFAHAGVIEAVEDGRTALLAPSGDVEKLAEKLRLLLENNELCERLGRVGRSWVESNFDLQIQKDKLQDTYDMLLNRRTRARPENAD